VPLVAAFATTAWLAPRAAAAAEQARLGLAAAEASQSLVRACGSLADRAALVATRVQLSAGAASAADVARAARWASAAATGGPGTVAVFGPTGSLLAAGGPSSGDLPGELAIEGTSPSCSRGSGAVGGLLAENVTTMAGGDYRIRIVAALPLSQVVAPAVEGSASMLVVRAGNDDGAALAVETAGAGLDSALRDEIADEVAGGIAASGPAASGEVAGRQYAAGPRVGNLTTVAVAPRAATASWPLLPLSVAILLVTGLLAVLVARAIGRPVVALTRLARRINDPSDPVTEAGLPAAELTELRRSARQLEREQPDELAVVRTTLLDLRRGLESSEADVLRAREALVASFERFGLALDSTPDRVAFLRAVGEAALLTVDGCVAAVSQVDPATASEVAPTGVTVTLLAPRVGGRPPVLLDGPAQEIDLTDAEDLTAATAGIRQLRDMAPGDAGEAEEGWAALLPMRHLGATIGHIGVTRRPGQGSPETAALVSLARLSVNVTTALVNVGRLQETAKLSVTDPLTGVGNVRHLTATLTREVERAIRFGHKLAVLMVDLDHFKEINDTHGHARGDEVLVEVARRLAGCVREVDTVARYGGEEFCLVLPETDGDGAAVLANRLLTVIAGEPFSSAGAPDINLTISVGIAAHPVHGRSGPEVMRVADLALYEAKRAGRNRVVSAPSRQDKGARSTKAAKGPKGSRGAT